MRTRRGMRTLTVAGLLAVLGLASGTRAQGKEIPLDRVPKAVMDAAKARFPGAKITKAVMDAAKARFPGAKIEEASEETKDEALIFELRMKHHRHDMGVTFKPDGTVVQAETAVRSKELPKVVLRALEHNYPGASIRHAVSVMKGPEVKKKADHYELYLVTAAKKPALARVDPDGKVLKPEAIRPAGVKGDKKELKKG